jgi:DNA-binding NtrC family response regulator
MTTELTSGGAANRLRTILVVDDFDDTRWLLRTWLERKGFALLRPKTAMKLLPRPRVSLRI